MLCEATVSVLVLLLGDSGIHGVGVSSAHI